MSVPHSEKLPVPKPWRIWRLTMTTPIMMTVTDNKTAQRWLRSKMWSKAFLSEHHLLAQADLNDFVRGLNLFKKWTHLHRDAEIWFFRNRRHEFKERFSQENDLLFCKDVSSVIEGAVHKIIHLNGVCLSALQILAWNLFFYLKRLISYVYWTVHHCNSWRIKDQLDITC